MSDTHTPPSQSAAVPATRVTAGANAILRPSSIGELFEFARVMARSTAVPDAYKEKPDDIFAAVQMGSELGLTPMQSLQNIAVINTRPTVWGDAIPALCKASPHFDDMLEAFDGEWKGHDGTADDFAAVCIMKRRGKQDVVSRFSVGDAKEARLWNKPGPWQTYPKRMLQMRARSWAARDQFPDTLKGLLITEEARDIPRFGADYVGGFNGPTIDADAAQMLREEADEAAAMEAARSAVGDAIVAEKVAPREYRFKTGKTDITLANGHQWMQAWAKVALACRDQGRMDKLEAIWAMNIGNIEAVRLFDRETAAALLADLKREFGKDQPAQAAEAGSACEAAPESLAEAASEAEARSPGSSDDPTPDDAKPSQPAKARSKQRQPA